MSDAVACTWSATTPGGLSLLLSSPQEPNSSSADPQQHCCSLAKPSNDDPCCLLVHLSVLEAAETLHLVISVRTCELSVQRHGDAQPSYIRTMRGTPATQGPPGACKQWLFDIPLTVSTTSHSAGADVVATWKPCHSTLTWKVVPFVYTGPHLKNMSPLPGQLAAQSDIALHPHLVLCSVHPTNPLCPTLYLPYVQGFPPHSTLQLKLLSHADRTQCHVYACQLRQGSSQPDPLGPSEQPPAVAPSEQPGQAAAGPHQSAAAQSQMEELRALLAVASGG
jgi:hypothetical protein